MAKVWLFIKAVFVHWYTLVGGCLLIVLLGLWERWRGASVPNVVFWGTIILLLFVACYKAWLNEHETTEYYKEKLEPKMELVFRHESPYEDCTHYGLYGKYREYYRIVRVGVLNTSPTDTIFSVSVTLKDFIYGPSFIQRRSVSEKR